MLGLPDDDLFRLFLGTIVSAANELRIPSFFDTSDVIDTGATMSYGPDSFDAFRRSASYIDKLAKGAKAAELPVEQPVKVEFVINAKRAAEFGLKIPREALLRADVVVR